MSNRTALLNVVSSMLALALGCGGGGSTGGGTNPPPPGPATVALGGSASKGIIQKGVVTSFELAGGAWVPRGTALTDAKGQYSLQLAGYAGGPVKVTITSGSDSTMIWDGPTGGTHAFGRAEALPGDFAMSSVLPALDTSTVTSLPVTPFTNMAAALVEASLPTANAASVGTCIATVNVMTGFDVTRTAVKDITDSAAMKAASATEQEAAAMAAAVTCLAGEGTVSRAVSNLGKSLAGGHFTLDSPIPIADLVQAWGQVLDIPGVAANLGDSAKTSLLLAAQNVTNRTTDGVYTPIPPSSIPATEVAAARQLIGDTRSFAYNLMATDFSTPLKTFGIDLDAAAHVFNRDTTAVAQILGEGIKQVLVTVGSNAALKAALLAQGSATYPVTITSGGQTLGTLTLKVTSPTAVVADLTGSLQGTATENRTVTVAAHLDTNVDVNQLDLATLTSTQTQIQASLSGSVTDGTSSLEITKGTFHATLEWPGSTYFVSALDLTDLALTIHSGGASFTGGAGISFIKADASRLATYFHNPYERFGLKQVKLNGAFTLGGVTSTLDVALDLANADTFDLLAFLNSGNTIDAWAVNKLPDATIQKIKAASRVAKATHAWSITYEFKDGQGKASSSGYDDANQVVNPGSVDSFSALTAAYDPGTGLDGTLPAGSRVTRTYLWVSADGSYSWVTVKLPTRQETASDFLKATLTTSFKVTGMAGLQDTLVSAVINRNTFQGGTAAFSLAWGTSTYTLQVDVQDLAARTGSLTVTNPQGVVLTLKDLNIQGRTGSGALYVGGTKVGDVTVLGSGAVKVTYVDGTFETFQ